MSKIFDSCHLSFFKMASLSSLFFIVLSVQACGQLVHPGISHKRSDLQRMKQMVEAGIEPWASTFAALSSHPRAQHDFPLDVVNQDPSFVIEYSRDSRSWFVNDGTTAYYNALMWYITGDERHAEKAIEVFNTYKGLRRNTSGIALQSGRVYRIIEAAEIIAHTYDGWDPVEMQEFKDMLVFPGYSSTTVPTQAIASGDYTFYWHVYNGDPVRHGNQGLYAMRTMMAMGIFLDNEVMYERTLRYLRGQNHRAGDLPYPSGPPSDNTTPINPCPFYDNFAQDGLLNTIPDYGYNEVISNYVYENGQCQESSRDQGHAFGGVMAINLISEMAWNQGDDLYGHLDYRALLGLEFYFRYNLSIDASYPDQPMPWEPTVLSGEYIERLDRSGTWRGRLINPGVECDQDRVTRGSQNLNSDFELLLGHYRDRMALPSNRYLWLQRVQDFRTQTVGEVETESDNHPYGSMTFRRVSPGDPISGFDSDGLPIFAMNELPMTIEAENFDHFAANGQGRTYSDNSLGNRGLAYRFDSGAGVDILESAAGEFYVGQTADGEFLTYTVNVPETGDYDIRARVSTPFPGASIKFSFDGVDATGEVAIPNTGGLEAWTTLTVAQDVLLSRGVQQLRVDTLGWFSFDNLEIIGEPPTPPDIAVNIDVPDGRGDGDAATPTVADFTSQNPGSLLSANTIVRISPGSGSASNFGNNFGAGVVIGGFTVTTTDSDPAGGTGTNSGFNAGDASHNDTDPITEGYAFGAGDTNVAIDGLLANSAAGDTIVLSIWGIGDNVGQQANFAVTYGSNTASEGNIQETRYNGPGQPRGSAVGSIPFVNFTFVADGVTDQISFDISNGTGTSNAVLNAFALSVTEPFSALLGDVNLSGNVDFFDISAFIGVLVGGLYQAEADCNEDGFVDFSDIPPFIAILIGN